MRDPGIFPTTLAALALTLGIAATAQAGAPQALLQKYRDQGAAGFNEARGRLLWQATHTDARSGQKRSCTTCHTTDLRRPGKHVRTGKVIQPMAPSVNPKRFTDVRKVEKWFRRNCKWTLGRECTPQEKGDILTFLISQ